MHFIDAICTPRCVAQRLKRLLAHFCCGEDAKKMLVKSMSNVANRQKFLESLMNYYEVFQRTFNYKVVTFVLCIFLWYWFLKLCLEIRNWFSKCLDHQVILWLHSSKDHIKLLWNVVESKKTQISWRICVNFFSASCELSEINQL